MTRRTIAALLAAGTLLVTSGCGSSTSPADDVPALATALDRVDEAIDSGDDAAARDAVTELAQTATRAEEAGDLDAGQADEIVAAADALLDELSSVEESPTEPSSSTSSAPSDEETDEETTPAGPESQGKPEGKPGKHKEPKGKKKK